jgi:hypothetical protein
MPGFWLDGLRGAQVQLLLIAALTFALTYVLVVLETGRYLLSWLVTAAVGLSATAFVYATEVYPEVPGALCIVASLLVLRRERPAMREAAYLALLLSALAWLSMKYVPLGCILAAVYLVRADAPGRWWFVSLSALSGVAYVGFHLAVFDHLTAYSVNTVYEGASDVSVLEDHLSLQDRAYRAYGLFIDRRFGVGRWAPPFLLALPSLPLLVGRGRIGSAAVALIVAQIAIATFLAITMMGYWFPGRTLMAVLPLFSLAIVVLLSHSAPLLRWAVGALGVLSLLTTAALVQASRSQDVRLAVDPFAMDAPGFQLLGRLFPSYQAWTAETVALTCAWLLAFLAGAAWAFSQNEALRPAVSRLRRRPGRPPLSARVRSSAVPPP